MSLPILSPQEAKTHVDAGALLIDIREPDEYASSHIPQARPYPPSTWGSVPLNKQGAGAVIFYCQSGHRTTMQQQRLTALAQGEAYIVEGGLNAWKRAGLPVDRGTGPISIMRQVQIAAGGLALLGTLLGVFVSSWFYLLPGFVGAGLMFAGFSGTCALACVLQRLPWNRNAGASCSP